MMSGKKACLILAEGFEEIEAVTVFDVMRRAGVELNLVGLNNEESWVIGSRGLRTGVDKPVSEVDAASLDLLVLPGGMPGTRNLAASDQVLELLRSVSSGGQLIGAICAAPMVLARAGLLQNKRVTCYPDVKGELNGAVYTGARVEKDELLITADGPGSALEFALTLVSELGLEQQSRTLRDGMMVK